MGRVKRNRNRIAAKVQPSYNLAKVSILDIMGAIMLNIFDIARHILDTLGEISPEKLYPLCYYAQGWHLATDGISLFQEDFVKYEDFEEQQGPVDGSPSVDNKAGHNPEQWNDTTGIPNHRRIGRKGGKFPSFPTVRKVSKAGELGRQRH
jgi:hypothetical protein